VAQKCAAGTAEGAACKLGECAPGLECAPATNVCTKITYAGSGQSCDDAVTRCDRGRCAGASTSVDSTGKITVTPGTCKDPIPDGSPCGATNDGGIEAAADCDTFSECVAGTCQQKNPGQCH
jgi:hypothetical protein